MKRFRFAYATLRRAKERNERLAAAGVARATLHVQACQARVARLRAALGELGQALERSLGQPLPDWAAVAEQSARLAEGLRLAEAEAARAEAARAEAVAAHTRARAEVEMLASLEQSQRHEHRQALGRADQLAQDDRALRGWRDGQQAEGPSGEESP